MLCFYFCQNLGEGVITPFAPGSDSSDLGLRNDKAIESLFSMVSRQSPTDLEINQSDNQINDIIQFPTKAKTYSGSGVKPGNVCMKLFSYLKVRSYFPNVLLVSSFRPKYQRNLF